MDAAPDFLARTKMQASEILDVMSAATPLEWEAAMMLALALYFRANYPGELQGAYDRFCQGLANSVEEADRQHGDAWDISALKLRTEDFQ